MQTTAVRLSNLPGVAVQDVAESLYIHPFMLSRWRKQVREGVIMAKSADNDKEVAQSSKSCARSRKPTLACRRSMTFYKKPSHSLQRESGHHRLHRLPPERPQSREDVQAVWSEREWLLHAAQPATEPASD